MISTRLGLMHVMDKIKHKTACHK